MPPAVEPAPGLLTACAGTRAAGHQEGWEAQAAALQATIQRLATELSLRRRAAAGALRGGVEETLRQLAMSASRFDARLYWQVG
jgi:DNA repair ATPase RecN